MRIYKEIFSSNLKQAIEDAGQTQGTIALAAGVTESMISDYLKGRFTPRPTTVIKLARALNVEPIWLSGELEKSPTIHHSEISDKINKHELIMLAARYASELAKTLKIDETHEDNYVVLLATLSNLNYKGLDKVISYTKDIVRISDYINEKVEND